MFRKEKVKCVPKSPRRRPFAPPPLPAPRQTRKKPAPPPAIFFGNSHASITLFSEFLPHPTREIVAPFNLRVMWSNLIARKSKSAFIGKLMLFRKFKIHDVLILSGFAR